MFVEDEHVRKGLIDELEKAISEVDCRGCKVSFSWDPLAQTILHVEVECPTFQDVKVCNGRIKVRLIEECEKRNIPHTIGEYKTFDEKKLTKINQP
jgi:hypothetical protein